MIRVNGLSFTYPNGVRALSNVSFSFGKGLLLIVGPSGSGKSTLSRLLAGVEPGMGGGEVSGEVEVYGDYVLKDGKLSRPKDVGLVLQNPTSQLLDLTPFDCVSDVLLQNGFENIEKETREILKKVGLERLANSYVFSLSDGERQRLALAQVLALNPKVLLLDEPLAHLDPLASEEFSSLLRRLADKGKTVLVFEHRLEYLYDLSDSVLILKKGRVEFFGTSRKVFNSLNGELAPEPLLLARKLGLKDAFSRKEIFNSIKNVKVKELVMYGKPGNTILELKNITFKRKNRRILSRVSFKIKRGEKVALVGENGSGKTTLSLISSGLLKPTEGKLVKKGKIMILFHPPEVQIIESRLDKMVGEEGLKVLNMEDRRGIHPMTLSKGERLRAVLLSILRSGPDLLILDEPTVGQDKKALASVMDLVEPLVKRGMALLFATHDLSFVAKYANRAIRLRNGRIIFDGPVKDYFLFERWFPRPFLVEATLKKAGKVALRLEEVDHG